MGANVGAMASGSVAPSTCPLVSCFNIKGKLVYIKTV